MQTNQPANLSNKDRRNFIKKVLQILSFSAVISILPLKWSAVHGQVKSEVSSEEPSKAYFIKQAVEMRQLAIESGDQAYGAIVVKNGKIVGKGPSRVIVNHDPTAHGEVEAIRDACRHLQTNDLSECELYSTAKPCQMCETAGYWANIARVYYGTSIVDGGRPRYSSC